MVVIRAMSSAERGGHVQLQLGAYVLGGLSEVEEAAVEAHLDRCSLCRAEYGELAIVPPWLDLLAGDGVDGTGEGWEDDPAPDSGPALEPGPGWAVDAPAPPDPPIQLQPGPESRSPQAPSPQPPSPQQLSPKHLGP
jgi:hypothetical protein